MFLACSFTFFLITTLFFNNTFKYIIIISKILCLSINARHHLQVRSIGCSGPQNGCKLHYHASDRVLTSGCSFISWHIWINNCLMLALLGRRIKSKTFCTGKRCMWIRIFGRQFDDLGTLSSSNFTSWDVWHFVGRWLRLWSLLSGSVRWKCTCSVASPSCLRIHCSAVLPLKTTGCVVLMKRSQMSSYPSHHLFMPKKLNTPLLPLPDLGATFLDQKLHFFHCGTLKHSIGCFPHIQGQAHVGLFQLNLVSTTGPNSRVGSGSGSTRNQTVSMTHTTRKTRPIGNGPVLPPNTQHFNNTTLPSINYLSSDRIMTWSVRRLCSSSRSFTSRSQRCEPTNIRWVAIQNLLISRTICCVSTATHRISVGSQNGKWEVKERPELHNLHTDHVTIRC